jgi:queuine tRNA-ribosyltransferase
MVEPPSIIQQILYRHTRPFEAGRPAHALRIDPHHPIERRSLCVRHAFTLPTSPYNKIVFRFELQAVCPATGARAGILHTAHGDVETPVFMPVGTQATVKGILPRDLLNDLDAKIILGNTYHLFLRPGHETVRRLGGLHRFMNWPRAILTDSGGFQVFSLNGLRKISEEGVLFRSHLNGDAHMFTPESTIDVQLALGSDIMMVLDECLEYPASHEAARVSTERTIRWARAAHDHFKQDDDGLRACFPIVQGSMYPDLRRRCAQSLLELDAKGYAIGGLSVGEPRALSLEMAEISAAILPRDKPRYVMGVGMPDELPQYVARGIDMMDCVLPSRNARNGYLFTSTGRVVIKQTQYKDDPRPIDESCACYACRNFSRAYLRHLFLAGEMTFSTLATLHNLKRYLDIMREIRQAILSGLFPEFLRTVSAYDSDNRPG